MAGAMVAFIFGTLALAASVEFVSSMNAVPADVGRDRWLALVVFVFSVAAIVIGGLGC